MSRGIVYLVGAGPGDPGLLTVRALELLRAAEVVAQDELVSDAILALASPTAELLRVGRRRGQGRGRSIAFIPRSSPARGRGAGSSGSRAAIP